MIVCLEKRLSDRDEDEEGGEAISAIKSLKMVCIFPRIPEYTLVYVEI